ncbi:MAG: hypothetical protein OXJ52_01900 [Oligoflexia bacterium]|nr:hypothetical protein [Oligoflexia bacterium]
MISVFLFTACGEWFRQAPPAPVGSGLPINYHPNNPNLPQPPNPTETETDPAPNPLADFGDVRCHSSQVTQFNNQVRNFLSTSTDPASIRQIVKCSSAPQWKGGFFIRGKVHFGGQKFNTQSPSQNLTVSQNSYLEIHIVDTNNRPVIRPPIRMSIEPYASAVQGQGATLVFQDKKGKVFLNGSVAPDKNNRPIFSGAFEFENSTVWNGSSQGLSGQLGTFKIPACRFFDCASSQPLPESLP